MIGEDEVRYIANLSRLDLDENEVRKFKGELGRILEYVRKLNEINTEGVEPISHVNEVMNVMREDIPSESTPRELMLRSSPKTDGKFFIVPRVVEE